ncbi:MAG TPA: triose-phosphate isomerase [Candidatus Saccharimonadales bacterium]|nr:triose-phosphate isomerase [Candidatus Saccharimonadales bacterium]
MTKRTLIVGNWKMNLNVHEASLLVKRLDDRISLHRDIEVVLAPSMLCLQPLSVQIDRRKFRLAAQNAFYRDEGAFTGEVSFTMLRDLVHYVIVGHSERRIYFHENLEMIRDKIQAAVRNEISPILCVGESQQERAAGETKRVIHDQINTALSNLTPEEVGQVVIAYEPVWAISGFGGRLAKPDEIEKIVTVIRSLIRSLYGEPVARNVRILYGGSVDDHIAGGYLGIEGVDGLLVGNASLNYHKFSGIVDSAHRQSHKDKSNNG